MALSKVTVGVIADGSGPASVQTHAVDISVVAGNEKEHREEVAAFDPTAAADAFEMWTP
jgi:hypothetical protein